MKKSASALLFVLLFSQTGCMIPETPSDLKLVSLKARMTRPDRFDIDARLSTHENFAKTVDRFSFNVWIDVYFCAMSEYAIDLNGGSVLDDESPPREVSGLDESGGKFDTSEHEIYYYTAVINGARKKPGAPGGAYMKPSIEYFDLRRDAQDICLRLAGGDGAFLDFHSNIVRIPKADIEAAVRDLPPPKD